MSYKLTSATMATLANNNCVLSVAGVPLVLNSVINTGDIVTATLSGDRVFKPRTPDSGVPASNANLSNCEFYFKYKDPTARFFFDYSTVSSDSKSCVLSPFTDNKSSSKTLYITTEQQTIEVSGTNNIYLIDYAKLRQINAERFIYGGGVDPTRQVEFDYGQYILNVLDLPFKVPTEYVLLDDDVYLGSHKTSIRAPSVKSDTIIFEAGEIVIPNIDNNFSDIKDTTCLLHLPFSESVELSADFCVGYTLKVQYRVDCYTGVANILIYSSKSNGIIKSLQVNIGVNIPYSSTSSKGEAVYNTDVSLGGDNGIRKAYLEVIRAEPNLLHGFFTSPITDEGYLLNKKGYVEIDKINLKTSALYNEKTELINILETGVIIK